MTRIDPFPGYRYAVSSNEELSKRLSPPYDRISPALRTELWDQHSENAVRVILPPPDDTGTDLMTQASANAGWYEEAGKRFQEWIGGKVVERDESSIYPYKQVFDLDGVRMERTGFFAALRLDPEDRALAHEKTFEGPKADRFRLMKACRANLSPILTLYNDPGGVLAGIMQTNPQPVASARTNDGINHGLYQLRSAEHIQALRDALKDEQIYIADGHHRYETSLRLMQTLRQEEGLDDKHPCNWTLAFLCPVQDPGLAILATHRLVTRLPNDWWETLNSAVSGTWTAKALKSDTECSPALNAVPRDQMAIIVSDGKRYQMLATPRDAVAAKLQDQPESLRKLDVVALHSLLLGEALGINEPGPGQIRYVKGIGEILEDTRLENEKSGSSNAAAFILRPVAVEDVRRACAAGCRMPPKSTDFFPKLPTGLLFRSLRP